MKCSNCGEQISVTDEFCPYCNSKNINFINKENESIINENNENNINKRVYDTNTDPRTIEELKEWYIARNLPPEDTTRFFIGKDYPGAKAFGIFKNEISGEIIVYKNKADGSRAIRYQGRDEAFAVSELLAKLKEEILKRKSTNSRNINNNVINNFNSRSRSTRSYSSFNKTNNGFLLLLVIFSMIIGSIGIGSIVSKQYGYYYYNDEYYYRQKGSWYKYYDDNNNYGEYDVNGWQVVEPPDELKKNYKKYYKSKTHESYYRTADFEDTSYYVPSYSSSSSYYDDDDDDWYSSSSYDWDDDDDWDWDSSDWDSDW